LRCFVYTLTILAVLTAPTLCHAQAGIITTVAGNGRPGLSGDGGPATSAQIGGFAGALGVAVDGAGNLYIADGSNNRVRKVSPAGIITTVAGGGAPGGLGDGGPATRAQVFPTGVAVDSAGNLYIAGGSLRKVNTSGIITTVADINATNVAIDDAGNLYLADILNHRIRKVDTAGNVTTIAGNGTQGYTGDGGPGTSAALFLPQGIAADRAGNVYFADNTSRIRKVDTAGIISTVAGNGSPIGLGEGVPALSTGMTPTFVAVDSAGNLYFKDTGTGRVRKISTAGTITTVAGGALALDPNLGDGGPATSARLSNPRSVAVDSAGNIYIADNNNFRIRKVSAAAALSVGASSLSFYYRIGDAPPANQTLSIASTGEPFTFGTGASTSTGGRWLAVSPPTATAPAALSVSAAPGDLAPGTYAGTIAIVASGASNSPQSIAVTLTVSTTAAPLITTVAGAGSNVLPFSGDGGPATSAGFLGPNGIAVDSAGNIYLADSSNNRIRKVDAAGIVTTLAGNGAITFAGDDGPATSGSFFTPLGVAVDGAGNVYIADSLNHRVRKVDTAGILTTVAGAGYPESSGDGGPATRAGLFSPLAVAVDTAGNLYIAETSRIRRVDTAGIITTVAGGALPGFSGDGGPATRAQLFLPAGVTVDASGNIYIADVGNRRIRKVTADGIISTVAGNGTKGFSGDGGPATSAQIDPFGAHQGLAADGAGNLYFADIANHWIRKVDTAGIISTVAGNGTAGFSGDGGAAFSASLNNPSDIALDSAGNLYIADTSNLRVRKVTIVPAP